MAERPGRRRVLVACGPGDSGPLRTLFAQELLAGWETLEAASSEQARFILQHNPCDVLLVDESLYRGGAGGGLDWLTQSQEAGCLFLTEPKPETLAAGLRPGIDQWLPRELALAHPALLAAALDRAAQVNDERRRGRLAEAALEENRRQIDRLVELLWQTLPTQAPAHWFTQRYMMERLQEEIVRTERHGAPLSLALVEVHTTAADGTQPPKTDLPPWVTDRITRAKRRCDVAGHYGVKGFILLLVHTPQAGAVACCHRLRRLMEDAAGARPEPGNQVRTYFGVASFSPDNPTSQGLLRRAEECLEKARRGVNGQVAF